jgi:hypothetical protein
MTILENPWIAMRFLHSLLDEAVCENHMKAQFHFKSIREVWYISDSRNLITFGAF